MNGIEKWIFSVVSFTTVFLCLCAFGPQKRQQRPYHPAPPPLAQQQWQPPAVSPPIIPNIRTQIPGHLNYSGIIGQLREWNVEAPELTEVGTYGYSSAKKELYFIRLHNKRGPPSKVVLITACIHGNEPLSTGVVMAYIGSILAKYGQDSDITKIVDERDIYFVPVVSPDSYPNSRHVDGVDPNRDFPSPTNPNKQSVPPISALQSFFKSIKPNAVISAHTFGRVFLYPYGDSLKTSPHHADYVRIIGEMRQLSNYEAQRACQLYNQPISGSEVDWYYRNGGNGYFGERSHRGAFSIVMEMGVHQRIPSMQDVQYEFNRTFKSVLLFVREAPLVEIWWDEQGNPANWDSSPRHYR